MSAQAPERGALARLKRFAGAAGRVLRLPGREREPREEREWTVLVLSGGGLRGRITELEVRHHPRRHGQSKYGLSRTIKVALDLITIQFLGRFSTKPMYLFGGLGFLSFTGATLLSAITLYQKYFEGIRANRNPLLLLAIFGLIAGLQFVLFGLLAELITRTYHESQNKPTYIVRDQNTDLKGLRSGS